MKWWQYLLASILMWALADCIYFQDATEIGSAPWWREMWIFAGGYLIAAIDQFMHDKIKTTEAENL